MPYIGTAIYTLVGTEMQLNLYGIIQQVNLTTKKNMINVYVCQSRVEIKAYPTSICLLLVSYTKLRSMIVE